MQAYHMPWRLWVTQHWESAKEPSYLFVVLYLSCLIQERLPIYGHLCATSVFLLSCIFAFIEAVKSKRHLGLLFYLLEYIRFCERDNDTHSIPTQALCFHQNLFGAKADNLTWWQKVYRSPGYNNQGNANNVAEEFSRNK